MKLIDPTQEQLYYIKLCKLLREKGYSNGSTLSFVEFQDDFIYDEDPSHPESHKKGEISIYPNMYFKNNPKEDPNQYEMPTNEKINEWLYTEKGFYVSVSPVEFGFFKGNIYKKDNLKRWRFVAEVLNTSMDKTPNQAYIAAFHAVLNKYLNKE